MSTLEERKAKIFKFKGAMVAALTPFDHNGEVDISQIAGYVRYLVNIKVDGFYIIGTTGEGYNLTNDEKLKIAKAWRQALDREEANLLSIINVTSNCLKEAVLLAKEIEKLGFDGIAILPPNYYRPNSVNDWVNYLKFFAEAAPNTPLLYYHIPLMNGELNFDIIEALGEGLKQIPQFAAMKFTDTNVIRFSILQKRYKNVFAIITGFGSEIILAALTALDCNSSICALFNLPEVVDSYKKVIDFVEQSDLENARKEHDKLLDLALKYKGDIKGNFIFKIKFVLNEKLKSLDLNFGVPRPPLQYHYKW